jgi:hypothetical protein
LLTSGLRCTTHHMHHVRVAHSHTVVCDIHSSVYRAQMEIHMETRMTLEPICTPACLSATKQSCIQQCLPRPAVTERHPHATVSYEFKT